MVQQTISSEHIQQVIHLIRGQKVILDRHLAALYCVPTKVLKQAVKRNAERFPADFMFVFSRQEFAKSLRPTRNWRRNWRNWNGSAIRSSELYLTHFNNAKETT